MSVEKKVDIYTEKAAMLDRYLISQNKRLEKGEILKVSVEDGYLTIFKEDDEKTKQRKTVVLFDEFDAKLNLAMKKLVK